MRVARGAWVTLDVALFDEEGQTLDEGEPERVRYRQGHGELLAALEHALEGADVGDEVSALLPPEEAFGDYQPEGLFHVPREEFGDYELELGAWVTIGVAREDPAEDAEEGDIEARIVDVTDNEVVLDANHPLAGRTVLARARVLSVDQDEPA